MKLSMDLSGSYEMTCRSPCVALEGQEGTWCETTMQPQTVRRTEAASAEACSAEASTLESILGMANRSHFDGKACTLYVRAKRSWARRSTRGSLRRPHYLGKDYTDQYLAKVCPKDPTLLQKPRFCFVPGGIYPKSRPSPEPQQEQPEEQPREQQPLPEEQQRPPHEQLPKTQKRPTPSACRTSVIRRVQNWKNITSIVEKA